MLVFVVGPVGSGKTLLLTILACGSNNPVCNFRVQGSTEFDIQKLLAGEYENCNIFLDEAYLYLESRTSSRQLNRLLSYVLFQSRKRSMNIFLSAQLAYSIDTRFRSMADVVIECEKANPYFLYHVSSPHGYHLKRVPFSKALPFFYRYDTMEVVVPIEQMDQARRIALSGDDLEREAREILEAIWKKFPTQKVTNDVVDYYFELHKLPSFLKKLVRVMAKQPKPKVDTDEDE